MGFWDDVYELREKGLIPRVWKPGDLKSYLQTPGEPYSVESISQRPSDESVAFYRDDIGLDVKNGKEPKAWRVSTYLSGSYKLVKDPDDDEDTQEKEHLLALLRAMELRAGWNNPLRVRPFKYIRPFDPPIPIEDWEEKFLEKWDARLNDCP